MDLAGCDKKLLQFNEEFMGPRVFQHYHAIKKSYLFVVTNCLFWKCYFVRKYNDKNGSGLCTYVCFILVLFNTKKIWTMKNFVRRPRVSISWKQWRAGKNINACVWAIWEEWQTADYVWRNLPLYSHQLTSSWHLMITSLPYWYWEIFFFFPGFWLVSS